MARQAITVVRAAPTFSAISVLETPSAASSMIRARCANPARTEVERIRRVSLCRSPSRNSSGAAG
nr:hypothetical protein [uncultured Kocuria sp.]